MSKITKDSTIAEILKNPEAENVLIKFNVPCLGCPMAQFEIKILKLEDVCKMYGIDLENLIKELNEKI